MTDVIPDRVMKANDLLPSLQATLTLGDDDTPAPLVDATGVNFIMQVMNASRVADVYAPCEIVDAANGVVRYDWQPGDTATPGDYRFEFEVLYPDAGGGEDLPQTYPTDSYLILRILADLDVGGA